MRRIPTENEAPRRDEASDLIRKAHYFLALRGGENFAVNVDRVALVLGFLGGDGRDGRGLLESWEDEPIIGERNGN